MEYLRTLRNNNTIYCGTRNQNGNKQVNSSFSIRFVFSGNEKYDIGNRQLSIYPDSFMILNKDTRYCSSSGSEIPLKSFAISFDDDFLQSIKNKWQTAEHALLHKYHYINRKENEFSETIYPLRGDMAINVCHLKYHLDNGEQDEQLINEYLKHCLINYYQVYKEEIFQKAERLGFLNTGTKIEILRRLSLAREYLYTHYNRNISLDELADYSCLSVTHLLRTFKRAYQITPHQFLIMLRLRRARLFLKETHYPVNEIVNLVGFECPSSFIRLFREHFKITPLRYSQTA